MNKHTHKYKYKKILHLDTMNIQYFLIRSYKIEVYNNNIVIIIYTK